MSDKTRWWAELALDVVSVVAVLIVASMTVDVFFPVAKDAELSAQIIPIILKGAAVYGAWKLFRSFNYLKGTPPS